MKKELAVTFSREQIKDYARASGDVNPIHLDDEFARRVGLDGVIAHGMLQMGLAARLFEGSRLRSLSVRFSSPVRPGDVVTFSAEGEGRRFQIAATNQRGEAVLTRGQAELVEAQS